MSRQNTKFGKLVKQNLTLTPTQYIALQVSIFAIGNGQIHMDKFIRGISTVFDIKTQREAIHISFVTLVTLSNIVLAERLGDEINNHKVNELQSAAITNIEKLKDLKLEF